MYNDFNDFLDSIDEDEILNDFKNKNDININETMSISKLMTSLIAFNMIYTKTMLKKYHEWLNTK